VLTSTKYSGRCVLFSRFAFSLLWFCFRRFTALRSLAEWTALSKRVWDRLLPHVYSTSRVIGSERERRLFADTAALVSNDSGLQSVSLLLTYAVDPLSLLHQSGDSTSAQSFLRDFMLFFSEHARLTPAAANATLPLLQGQPPSWTEASAGTLGEMPPEEALLARLGLHWLPAVLLVGKMAFTLG
jgi:hypothetical protein